MEFQGYKDTDLIPELHEWKKLNGEDFSVEDWLDFHQSAEFTIAYSTIFCPNFIQVANGIYFKHTSDDSIENIKMSRNRDLARFFNGDVIAYQKDFNSREIPMFAYSGKNAVYFEQVEFIGNLLAKIWRYQLQAQFLEFNIFIETYGLNKTDWEESIITFWAEPKN